MSGCCCGSPEPKPLDAPPRSDAPAPETGPAWWRIGVGVLLGGQSMALSLAINISGASPMTTLAIHAVLLGAAGAVFLLLGPPLLRDAARDIRRGALSLELLFLTALAGAVFVSLRAAALGEGDVYFETVIAVLLIYSVGRRLKRDARARAADAVREARRAPSTALRVDEGGDLVETPVHRVRPGDTVAVRVGAEVPVDGVVVDGRSLVQEAALTGESAPVRRSCGQQVLAGSVALDGALRVRTLRAGGDRYVDRAVQTLERDLVDRSRLQTSADRLLRWFVPAVWTVSIATLAYWWPKAGLDAGVLNAMSVLLVACPCALGFATPTAIASVCARLGRAGIAVRSGALVESLAEADAAVFDKTGTLTDATLEVADVVFDNELTVPARSVARAVAAMQSMIDHPVARALRSLSPDPAHGFVRDVQAAPGFGVRATATFDDRDFEIAAGDPEALTGEQAQRVRALESRIVASPASRRVVVLVDGAPAAVAALDERVVEPWERCRDALRQRGLRVVIMTGDAAARAERLGADEALARLTPEQKRDAVRAMRRGGERVLFVGDGLNDSAAMGAADASVALSTGSDLPRRVADAIAPPGALAELPGAIDLSRRAVRTIRGNLAMAVAYNAVGMSVAAAGLLHPVLAAAVMIVSSLTVTWRSLRLLEDPRPAPPRSRSAAPAPVLRPA